MNLRLRLWDVILTELDRRFLLWFLLTVGAFCLGWFVL